ncbi:MAG: hypothetical protein K940chlam6_00145 [Chlamydiae bacterium]|nr:hypothetical protein [Chlamydiota bacterium]
MMQGKSIPASIFYNGWYNQVTSFAIGILQVIKLLILQRACFKANANGSLHCQKVCLKLILTTILKRGAALPPSPKGLGFRAVIFE